jgi:predicted nucleic acid-binding protein
VTSSPSPATAIDTNIIVAFLDRSLALDARIEDALESAAATSTLLIAAPVYAELLALPGRADAFLDRFLADTEISVDWLLSEQVWRTAGKAHQAYVARRRVQRTPAPRRLLTDFLIGAHALTHGYSLLTLDQRHYRAAFPKLKLLLPR